MTSRPKAGDETSRPDALTRRGLIVSGPAAAICAATSTTAADESVIACDTWLARYAEHERLSRRWQQIENLLFKEHDWPRLTRAQRRRFREQSEMDDLYDRMDVLHDENCRLLALLPTFVATTPAGIAGKLSVAAAEVCPEENEEAHLLIASILRDFRALTGI